MTGKHPKKNSFLLVFIKIIKRISKKALQVAVKLTSLCDLERQYFNYHIIHTPEAIRTNNMSREDAAFSFAM